MKNEVNETFKYVGYSNGRTYNLYVVDLKTNTGLCDIVGFINPLWCKFEKIEKINIC